MAKAQHSTTPRREWLKLLGVSAGGLIIVPSNAGCSYYPAESGAAYAPWDFPSGETRPELVATMAAILASSAHNAQPWAFHVTSSQIDVHADFTRNTGSVDGLSRELYISLGCALENLVIGAQASGRAATVDLLPQGPEGSLVASVSLTAAPPSGDPLFSQIAHRHTNRGRYAEAPPSAALQSSLQALVTDANVQLTLLTGSDEKAGFRAGTIGATKAFNADAQMSSDSNSWFRQSAADILEHRDGITLDCSGASEFIKFWGKSLSRPSDATANSYWLKATEGDQTTASAFCLLSSPDTNVRADQLSIGRVYQRMHLWAASVGLALQPLNQMAERQDREQTQGLFPEFTTVLNALIGAPARRAQMLFRIGYPWDPAPASPRRPLDWVLL